MPEETKTSTAPETGAAEIKDELTVTHGSVQINKQTIPYTVTTGTIVLKEEDEENKSGPKSHSAVFFVAYTRSDVDDPQPRPLTFSFNGGPGSSSVWLHMGLLGPRRVLLDAEGQPLPPPYRLVDNEYSLLDVTDLVFIDPIGTGYSRAAPGEKPEQFFQFTKDIETVAEFIRLYTTRAGRWNSPKFLIGESYGTTRAVGVADHLQQRHGMMFNGLMLVSAILDFMTVRFHPGNDLPAILHLPTYTATAWYHQQLPDDLQQQPLRTLLEQVEAFAINEYGPALLKGTTLGVQERNHIVEQLARYTGLEQDYIERTNLRIEIQRFVKELLRSKRRTVGRLDTRYIGIDRDAAGESFEYDPAYAAIQGAYTATFNDYVRRELRFESDLVYEILNFKVFQPWKYDKHANRYVSVVDHLRTAMSQNRFLKVLVASGYYDLATPHMATNYTFTHLGLEPHLQQNITMTYYEAGHMMYVHQPSLQQLKTDLTDFVAAASQATDS